MSSLKIPAAIQKKLNRLIVLTALGEIEETEEFDVDTIREYLELTGELTTQFLPVVKMLAVAGLLTINMRIGESERPVTEYDHLSSDGDIVVWPNGGIWLDGTWTGCGAFKKDSPTALRLKAEREVPMVAGNRDVN
jgi:hypothetical protein